MTTVKHEMELEIPLGVNFLRVRGIKDAVIPVGEVPDERLREIGAAWTERLLEAARNQRAESTSFPPR